jgi:hypothetical protein
LQRSSEGLRIFWPDDQGIAAVAKPFRNPTDVGGHDRFARAHRFKDYNRHCLIARGTDKDIGRRDDATRLVVFKRRSELNFRE